MIREAEAICWPQGGTVGCMTVAHHKVKGGFPSLRGNDGKLCCHIGPAGKYRNGAARSWCRTHQQYWGVKADLALFAKDGVQRCAGHDEPMHYVLDPVIIDVADYRSITLKINTPALIDMEAIPMGASATLRRQSLTAFAFRYRPESALFRAPDIGFINMTADAVAACHQAVNSGASTGCIDCARCGHPHLDLSSFSRRPHRRHTCGHCGNDSTHSAIPLISNPMFALLSFYGEKLNLVDSNVHQSLML